MNTSPLRLVSDTPAEEVITLEWEATVLKQLRYERDRRKNQARKQALAFHRLSPYIAKIETVVKQWDTENRVDNLSFDNSYYGARLCIYLKRIASWRELMPLFEALEAAGVDANNWQNTDIPESYTRSFQNTLVGEEYCSDSAGLMIYASLKPDDAECKRIVVGWTKPEVYESRPIYAFDCGDTPASKPVETGIPATPADDIPF